MRAKNVTFVVAMTPYHFYIVLRGGKPCRKPFLLRFILSFLHESGGMC